jgi:ABC-2 type transport system ATP-binding protein
MFKQATDKANVLRLENVVKRFGNFTAVDDLSFAVGPGEVFGFLGLS